MSVGLQNYPDTTAPDSDFPNGNIKDDTGADDGTPVDKTVYADMHQTLAKLLRLASIIPTGLPDNEYSGFQYIEALTGLFSNGRQKKFITGLAVSTVIHTEFSPDIVVSKDAATGQILSINIAGAPLIAKFKVRNYSYNPVSCASATGETFNSVASPFSVPSRSVIEFQLTGTNWVIIDRFIMP